jgi:hypothetical protein
MHIDKLHFLVLFIFDFLNKYFYERKHPNGSF